MHSKSERSCKHTNGILCIFCAWVVILRLLWTIFDLLKSIEQLILSYLPCKRLSANILLSTTLKALSTFSSLANCWGKKNFKFYNKNKMWNCNKERLRLRYTKIQLHRENVLSKPKHKQSKTCYFELKLNAIWSNAATGQNYKTSRLTRYATVHLIPPPWSSTKGRCKLIFSHPLSRDRNGLHIVDCPQAVAF